VCIGCLTRSWHEHNCDVRTAVPGHLRCVRLLGTAVAAEAQRSGRISQQQCRTCCKCRPAAQAIKLDRTCWEAADPILSMHKLCCLSATSAWASASGAMLHLSSKNAEACREECVGGCIIADLCIDQWVAGSTAVAGRQHLLSVSERAASQLYTSQIYCILQTSSSAIAHCSQKVYGQ